MKNSKSNSADYPARRAFIKRAGLGAVAGVGMPGLLASSIGTERLAAKVSDYFSVGSVTLFQGDSITDAGRNRQQQLPNHTRSFGTGYAYIIASSLLEDLAEKNLTFYNRGISGNKVYQLADRWQEDCLDLKPDILSILIGVNDYWHMRNGKYDGTPEVYEKDYHDLLQRTKSELPDINFVICQPFILAGTTAVDESWLEPFKPYQEIAHKMAVEFGAIWVPFQEAFDQAVQVAPSKYWANDGVHPSMAGCQLMAETWLKALS